MAIREAKRVHTTGNREGFVVMLWGGDDPMLLRRDERAKGGYAKVRGSANRKRPGKSATVFTKWGTANSAGKAYSEAHGGYYVVFPVAHEDTDHVSIK